MRTTSSWKQNVIATTAVVVLHCKGLAAFVSFHSTVAFTPPLSIVSTTTTTRGSHPRLYRKEFRLDTFQGFQEPSIYNDTFASNDDNDDQRMLRLELEQQSPLNGKLMKKR
jgi:hypothetical protein